MLLTRERMPVLAAARVSWSDQQRGSDDSRCRNTTCLVYHRVTAPPLQSPPPCPTPPCQSRTWESCSSRRAAEPSSFGPAQPACRSTGPGAGACGPLGWRYPARGRPERSDPEQAPTDPASLARPSRRRSGYACPSRRLPTPLPPNAAPTPKQASPEAWRYSLEALKAPSGSMRASRTHS